MQQFKQYYYYIYEKKFSKVDFTKHEGLYVNSVISTLEKGEPLYLGANKDDNIFVKIDPKTESELLIALKQAKNVEEFDLAFKNLSKDPKLKKIKWTHIYKGDYSKGRSGNRVGGNAMEKVLANIINDYINDNPGIFDIARPKVSNLYSDISISKDNKVVGWIESKLTVQSPLCTPRFYYTDGRWYATADKEVNKKLEAMFNENPDAKAFIDQLAESINLSENDKLKLMIPSTVSQLNSKDGAIIVTTEQMERFLKNRKTQSRSKKIICRDSGDFTKDFKQYCLTHKGKHPGDCVVNYIQIGDNFYVINNSLDNPLPFDDLDELSCKNCNFIFKITVRADKTFDVSCYPYLPTLTNPSKYSFLPNSKKPFPPLKSKK